MVTAISGAIVFLAINHWIFFSLKRAIDNGDVTSVKHALLEGVDPNAEFRYTWFEYRTTTRPLNYAVMKGNVDIIQTLLEFSADPNLFDYNGQTALMNLLGSEIDSKSRNEIFEILIKITKLDIQDVDGYNVLHVAAIFGDRNEYATILKNWPQLAEVPDKANVMPPKYFSDRMK